MLNVPQRVCTPWYWVEGGLSVCFQSVRRSGMYQSYFLVGGSYGDATLLGFDHILLGVLVASDVFWYAGQNYRRSARGLFIHQATLRPTREGFEKCGSQGVIDDV